MADRKIPSKKKTEPRTWLRLAAITYPNELKVFNDKKPSAHNRRILKDWGDSLFVVRITEVPHV